MDQARLLPGTRAFPKHMHLVTTIKSDCPVNRNKKAPTPYPVATSES